MTDWQQMAKRIAAKVSTSLRTSEPFEMPLGRQVSKDEHQRILHWLKEIHRRKTTELERGVGR